MRLSQKNRRKFLAQYPLKHVPFALWFFQIVRITKNRESVSRRINIADVAFTEKELTPE